VILETLIESIDLAEEIVKRVADASGFDEDDIHRIGMAVREGAINAYNYGNSQERDKKIILTVEFEDEKMIVHIADEGPGFDLSQVPDPLAEENLLRTSGRGIFIIKAFMDEFSVQRGAGGGAEIVMTKKLPQTVPAPERA
jgi:serine/threonine-protein kinase RsbW